MNKFENYIDGGWVKSKSNSYFKNVSPANSDDVIGEFPLSDLNDLNDAVASSVVAYKLWKNTPAPKRGDILRIAGDIFSRRKSELAKVMTREMGKPTFETEGDVQEAIDTCY